MITRNSDPYGVVSVTSAGSVDEPGAIQIYVHRTGRKETLCHEIKIIILSDSVFHIFKKRLSDEEKVKYKTHSGTFLN